MPLAPPPLEKGRSPSAARRVGINAQSLSDPHPVRFAAWPMLRIGVLIAKEGGRRPPVPPLFKGRQGASGLSVAMPRKRNSGMGWHDQQLGRAAQDPSNAVEACLLDVCSH